MKVSDVLMPCDGAVCSSPVFLGSHKKPTASPDNLKTLVSAVLKIEEFIIMLFVYFPENIQVYF